MKDLSKTQIKYINGAGTQYNGNNYEFSEEMRIQNAINSSFVSFVVVSCTLGLTLGACGVGGNTRPAVSLVAGVLSMGFGFELGYNLSPSIEFIQDQKTVVIN